MTNLLNGDTLRFSSTVQRLDTLKIGNVRSILNREQAKLLETEGDAFNSKFKLTNDGDEEEDSQEEEKEEAPQIVTEDGKDSLA